MKEFVPSKRKDSIFYGDIFKINEKGCLIFGFGKTKASRIASDWHNYEDNEVALDFACMTTDKGNSYGHFEFEFRLKDNEDPINQRVKLDYLLRMLDEKETIKVFKDMPLQVIEVSYDVFVKISKFNILYGANDSSSDRIEHFKKLTQNKGLKTFVVPWMEDVQSKGNLIKTFLSK